MLLIALSAYLNERNAIGFYDTTQEVERINQVIGANELLLSSLKDLETGQRGYLLTGDAQYLTPFEQAIHDLPGRLESLQANVIDPGQQDRVRRLMMLVPEKRAEVEATILVRNQLGSDAALAIVKSDKGRESMETIRSLCSAISREGHETLLSMSADLARRQRRASLVSAGITLALFIILVVAAVTIQRGVRHRDQLLSDVDSARQQFQTTLLSIGDGVVATNAEGEITFLNSMACRISGWTEANALGKKVEEVLPFVDELTRQPVEHPVHRALREKRGGAMAHDSILLQANGSKVMVEDSAAPIFADGRGRLTGAVLVFRDTTSRHMASRVIRKWEHVFEHAGFGMAILELGDEPSFEQINPAFGRMHGYQPDELTGLPLSQVVSPAALEAETKGLRDAEVNGHLIIETVHRRKDGTQFPTLADVTVVRDENDRVLYGTAYYSDITERVRAEEELRRNEERYRTLADSLPQLVWTALPDGTPDYWNTRWHDEVGHRLDAADGDGFLYFVHPDDQERCRAEWAKALGSGSIFETECRLRNARAKDRWYICRAIPVHSADGRIVRWFGSCTDIDEQKRAAEELRANKDELQRSNTDLEQFAFAASHDLQEPLRMVVIYSQLLKEEYGSVLGEQGKTYLNFAVDGALRMEQLLKGLLAYARATTPEEVAPPEGVCVAEGARKAIANLAIQIEENHAKLSIGDLPKVNMPEVHIIQVFQNLIGNAIKYRRPDVDPVITITAERKPNEWLFAVKDNGIGIDANYREVIFRVFGRLHGAEYPGTGIGLALCRRLIKRNGGRMWVESTPGSGSTFFFTLPTK